jgi:hypothetical protein
MDIKYNYVDVKDEIVKALKPEMEPLKVKVIKADPREQGDIPCIGINRAGDDESNQVIGEEIGDEYDPETDTFTVFKGTYFNETLEMRLWHTNADERDRLYILMKAILFAMRDDLAEKGLRNITLRGGKDEQENNILPQPLYWSSITMNFLNPLEIERIAGVIKEVNVDPLL